VTTGPSLPSPVTELADDRLAEAGVRVFLKRDDLIHPRLPGNKWRKLQHNLSAASDQGHDRLLTFGGAYSNHLRATAAAGAIFGFETVGVIRGEPHVPLNPVLASAEADGMRLTYLDRTTYRSKRSPEVLEHLQREWGRFYLLPEGGSNALAARGCTEIASELAVQVPEAELVCCPVGTGGTVAGLAGGLGPGVRALGFAVLKGGGFLIEDVESLQREAFGAVTANWALELGFHFGGYARSDPGLERFAVDFEARHGLALDRIYVARMLFGVFAMIADGRIPAGSTVVAVITGPGPAGPGEVVGGGG
jgi:1-aminocyclopropane-1-carboxylate deaminase